MLDVRKCQRWFSRFKEGNLSLEDSPRPGRPVTVPVARVEELVEADPSISIKEIAKEVGCSETSAWRHIRALGKVCKLGKWVPHLLTQHNKDTRVSLCSSLYSRLSLEPFLERIVTGDEKWVLYVNVKRRTQWMDPKETPSPVARPDLHPRKAMLSVWWDMSGVIHFELLEPNKTITATYYCEQLDRLYAALKAKRPYLINRKGVILHHDNARPHAAKITK